MNRRQLILGVGLAGAMAPLAACGQGTGRAAPQATSTSGPAVTGAAATQQTADKLAAAQKEGKVLVYSTTDSASAKPLLDDFKALYSGVNVEYSDLSSTEMYNKFTAE